MYTYKLHQDLVKQTTVPATEKTNYKIYTFSNDFQTLPIIARQQRRKNLGCTFSHLYFRILLIFLNFTSF